MTHNNENINTSIKRYCIIRRAAMKSKVMDTTLAITYLRYNGCN